MDFLTINYIFFFLNFRICNKKIRFKFFFFKKKKTVFSFSFQQINKISSK